MPRQPATYRITVDDFYHIRRPRRGTSAIVIFRYLDDYFYGGNKFWQGTSVSLAQLARVKKTAAATFLSRLAGDNLATRITPVSSSTSTRRPARSATPTLERVVLDAATVLIQTYAGQPISPDIDRQWERLQKLVSLAVRPGTPAEGRTAARMAFRALVDIVLA